MQRQVGNKVSGKIGFSPRASVLVAVCLGLSFFMEAAFAAPAAPNATASNTLHVAFPDQQGAADRQYQDAVTAFRQGEYAEAVDLWRDLGERGNVEAQFTLGTLYQLGQGGLTKEPQLAAHWYQRAAEQGHQRAQYNLGVLYASRDRGDPDMPAAARWWRMAAMQGHAEAQFNLGSLYAEGAGVERDLGQAARWWRVAASQGYAPAQFNLGLMYLNGEGVDEDPSEALRLWELSAGQGFEQAVNILKVLQLDR